LFNQFVWKSLAASALFLTLIACGKTAQVQPTVPTVVPNTHHIVATKSSHYVQIEQPALVIDAVRQVIGSASPIPTP
jgi:pimeloyl-ACP methyl ester carboxylesterase